MLPNKNRLKKTKDFENVFKKGNGFKENFLVCKVSPNGLNISRFGFVISQKVSKKANVRNKLKRRLRELVKSRLINIKRGIDGILICQPGSEKLDFDKIEEVIDRLFKKAKITR